MCIRDRHKDNPSSDKHAGQPAESDDAINTMSGALDPGPVVLTGPEPWMPHLAALTRTGQGVEPVPVPAARVLARLHQSNRRDLPQPLPLRCGLGQGHDLALHLRVADLLTRRMRVLPGAKRIVEHHPGATKRPGQQRSLAWGRVRAVTVTSEHPLNVVSPTDIDRCCPCRHPPQAAIPDLKDQARAAQIRRQPKGGSPVEMGTGFLRDPSMTARLPNGALSEIRTSLAP